LALAGRKQDARDTTVPALRRLLLLRQPPGSVATLIIADDSGATSIERLGDRFAAMLDRGIMRIAGDEGRGGFAFRIPYIISPSLAGEILKETGRSLADLRQAAYQDTAFRPIPLPRATVRIESRVSKELRQTENVIGLLEGSDPKLKDEYVVFTAHYDHEGIRKDGTIYYGADDDGSGTVTVLELAEAYATNPVKPKRSLLFMTVTGEEKGLLGSRYYVTHPIFPLERTVADLNTDMIGRMDAKYEGLKNPNYVYVIGSDKISTQLDSLLKVSNQQSENLILDYTYNDDKDPEQFYRRSDHYNFARNGIPIVFFFTGIHKDYHRPTDTVDKILFDRMARIARLIYYTGWKAADLKTKLTKNVESSMYAQ
jgi:Zn-dependent M28 family amino/carboxypeptidase